MEYMLETDRLCKRYRRFRALDALTMHVPRGAIYGIVGRNGAGKTTLMRLLCGLQRPTAGDYSICGVSGRDRAIGTVRRRMGAVVETPSVYLGMTARDNLREQCRMLGLPSEKGLEEILSLVGLTDTGKKTVRHFSLGMKQRLGIAIALVGDPDLLMLDEPANGLDPQGIIEIRELILKLNRQRQITVLISSHILDELHRLATWYGFIDSGRMLREMSAQELEAACRKCVRLTVSDPSVLARVLNEKKMEYTILPEHTADVYTDIEITELVRLLDGAGCRVISMRERDESLESFFVSLVGGAASSEGGERHA